MNKIFSVVYHFSLFLIVFCLTCCGSPQSNQKMTDWKSKNGKLKVLSTISMIDDLIKQVGQEHIDSTVLINGELDPHSYQLVKGDDEKLAYADLIFYNGLGLEHGPSLRSYLTLHEQKTSSLGNAIMQANPELLIHYKGQVDPHIWMDISLWTKAVPFIIEALSAKDPSNRLVYLENGKKLIQEMQQIHEQVKQEMHSIPPLKRYLVTTHDAFNYFTRAYLAEDKEKNWSDRFMAPEGLAPESQISTTDIQNVIEHLTRYQIEVMFPESNTNRDSIRKICQAGKEKGLNVRIANVSLYADAMGKKGSDGDTYLKMIQHDAKAIVDNLKLSGKKD